MSRSSTTLHRRDPRRDPPAGPAGGNFLRFAKSERRERQPLDLGELLRDTVRLVEKESERRRVRLELDTDGKLPLVLADAESIRSSLLNLILNSFEAMPEAVRCP